jgi:predicted amino acid dehydrogenase
VRLAEKKEIGILGLGALTASLSRGGKDVSGLTKVGITTGRAFTVKTVTGYALEALRMFKMQPQDVRIAIVGAAGAIGSGSAKILAKNGVRHFLFIDLERKALHLKKHIEEMKGIHGPLHIEISHQIRDIKGSDIIIAATNAPEVLITSDDLNPGTIVINDAQPSDISPEVLDRDDVLVIEGGVIKAPGISCNFNMGLAERNDTFCCLGEALILAHNGMFEDFALGELDVPLVDRISELSKTMDISLSHIQNEKGLIAASHIERIQEIIASKKLGNT